MVNIVKKLNTLKAIVLTSSLLLGSSMSVFASNLQDEFDPVSLINLNPASNKPNNQFEEKLDTLFDELLEVIISSLQRKDQGSVRGVSKKMKQVIDERIWPSQSCTIRSDRLFPEINTIKSLPFRSLVFTFKKWQLEDIQSLSCLTNLKSLNVAWSLIGGQDNQIGDRGAEALAQLTNLKSLYVSYNQIGNSGNQALERLSHRRVYVRK